jgi:hypothetical protein
VDRARGLGGAEELELFYFESLSAMIDESDAAVVGTITSVVPAGRSEARKKNRSNSKTAV